MKSLNTSIPEDMTQRELALDISLSCCVQAPAGSGKTELLTQRILKLLALCDRPEEILAITFTRKAASEMRNRLLDNLEEAASLSAAEIDALPPHKQLTLTLAKNVLNRDQQQGWSLLANTSRLRINTIDSFNQFLVNQLPVTSSLGMMPDITDKPREIFRDAVKETLGELGEDSKLSDELNVLLIHLNNQWGTLENLFCSLLSKRDQWLSYILYIRQNSDQTRQLMELTLSEIVENTLADLETTLSPYLPRLLPLLHYAIPNLLEAGETRIDLAHIEDSLPANQAEFLPQWQVILSILLTAKCTPRKTVLAKQGFLAQSAPGSKEEKAQRKLYKQEMEALLQDMSEDPELLEKFEEFNFLPYATFNNKQWRVLESLTVILPELVSRLNLVFARHQRTDYNHISGAALEALGDDEQPTDLALRLDYHLKHILVDEFQDTSSLQTSLLKKLTNGWQSGDGRTLFIVGDGMQSCYGFRNARVGLFLAARDNGIGDIQFEDLRLTSNFRSEAAVVDWVNTIFQGAFPRHDDISRGGVSFNPARSVHDSTAIAGVLTCLVNADKELEESRPRQRLQEAMFVADQIQTLQNDFPGDSIAVLVRTRNHLRELIPVLREYSLQWNASEIDPLLSYPVIRDLLSLTRALLNLADTPAWLAFLRSPVAGLALADIHCLSQWALKEKQSLWHSLQQYEQLTELSSEAQQILSRVVPVLILARRERQRLPLRDWLENVWILLGGPATLEDPQLIINTGQFFNLLEEHDNGGDITDIHLFESELSSFYGGGQHPEASLQIMTIHKAKGLEFDHVIIPGLDRSPRGNENSLLLWKEHITSAGEERLVMSLPSQKGKEMDKDSIYHYLKCELDLEQRLESTRLLYIAVTRAIRQAILVACVNSDKGEISNPPKQSLLARIWPQLKSRLDGDDCRLLTVDDNSPLPADKRKTITTGLIRSRRLPPAWQNPLVPDFTAPEDKGLSLDADDLAHQHQLEKKFGEIIHYCLMQLVRGELDLDNKAPLQKLAKVWRKQLENLTDQPDQAITNIVKQLKDCQSHEKFSWIISTDHQHHACEQAISDFSRGGRREYIIDRTFLDSDGTRWIIDYKSSRPAQGETLETFARRQSEKYRDQLANYARLYKAMEDSPVRTALFFTAIPYFHEIVPEQPPREAQSVLF